MSDEQAPPIGWDTLNLASNHLERIQQSGVSPEVAAERGYRTVTTPEQVPEVFNRTQRQLVPALLIPIYGVDDTDEPITYELRPDNPRTDGRTARNGAEPKARKYEFPANQAKRLDVPRRCRPQIGDPNTPLWITEGARKADAAAARGMCAVSLAGVWAFRSTNVDGGKVELPDFDKVAFNDRAVYVTFDSDVMTKQPVRAAILRLAAVLKRRGAHIHIVVLPAGPRGEKQGLDDLLASGAEHTDLARLVDPDFLNEDDRDLGLKLHDYIMDAYELGQDRQHNTFALPRNGPRLVRMLYTGRPSLELEAPAAFRLTEPGTPIISRRIVRDVLPYIEQACLETHQRELYLRTAPHNGGVVIDMGDPDGRVIYVTATGWEVIDKPGDDFPLFRRTEKVNPLPEPTRGGTLDELRALVHVNDSTWPLVKGWMLASVFGWVPRPWLYHAGPQGSGKSDAALMAASVVDPRASISSFPRKNDRSDPGAVAYSTYLLGWDNLTKMPEEVSDWLCATVTGNQDERRVLHTTSTVQTMSFMRSGVLTGIEVRSVRPDLLERLVKVQFERLPADGKRRREDLFAEFARLHPRILGGLLDAVATSLANRDKVPGNLEVPRMADYASILKAYDLGTGEQLFEAYRDNVYALLDESGAEDAVGQVVLDYVDHNGAVKMTPGDLYTALTEHRNRMGANEDAYWPKNPRMLSVALQELVASLERSIRIQVGVKSNGSRWVILTPVLVAEDRDARDARANAASLPASLESSQVNPGFTPDRDARDATFQSFTGENQKANKENVDQNERLPFGSYSETGGCVPCVPQGSSEGVFPQVTQHLNTGTQDRDAASLRPEANDTAKANGHRSHSVTDDGLFPGPTPPPAEPRPAHLPTPAVYGGDSRPAHWVTLFSVDAPDLDPPTCDTCGAEKVPDAEMAYFLLCPRCTPGTLRPADSEV